MCTSCTLECLGFKNTITTRSKHRFDVQKGFLQKKIILKVSTYHSIEKVVSVNNTVALEIKQSSDKKNVADLNLRMEDYIVGAVKEAEVNMK